MARGVDLTADLPSHSRKSYRADRRASTAGRWMPRYRQGFNVEVGLPVIGAQRMGSFPNDIL